MATVEKDSTCRVHNCARAFRNNRQPGSKRQRLECPSSRRSLPRTIASNHSCPRATHHQRCFFTFSIDGCRIQQQQKPIRDQVTKEPHPAPSRSWDNTRRETASHCQTLPHRRRHRHHHHHHHHRHCHRQSQAPSPPTDGVID